MMASEFTTVCGWAMAGSDIAAELLPLDCRLDPLPQLLSSACRLCLPAVAHVDGDAALSASSPSSSSDSWPSAVVCREDDGTLADVALEVVMGGPQRWLQMRCPLAFFAAYLVTLQYSVSTRVLELPDSFVGIADSMEFSWDGGFDLTPFPFTSSRRSLGAQLVFHQHFLAAHVLSCDNSTSRLDELRGKFALRAAHDKPEYHCVSRASDLQLLERCRARRRAQWHASMWGEAIDVKGFAASTFNAEVTAIAGVPPPRPVHGKRSRAGAIDCPTEDQKLAWAFAEQRRSYDSAKRKYSGRAAGDGCESPTAEWKVDLGISHKCVLVVIMDYLRLRPGAVVLDWGAGCGHKLTWAAQLYDIDGIGIDIVEDSVAWAREHSIGHFCHSDGRFLEWLPDDYFDAIISYAALMHLEPDDACQVVVDLVGKVRVGGRLWFGWNAPGIWRGDPDLEKNWMYPPDVSWRECFAQAAGNPATRLGSGQVAIAWETVEEGLLFPDDMHFRTSYLYWEPAYSLFVTRVQSGQTMYVSVGG